MGELGKRVGRESRAERRFGARFDVADALGDYGGTAKLVPPAPGPRQTAT